MRTTLTAGWIQGTSASQLEARGLTTRAQSGVIMLRILQQAGIIDARQAVDDLP